MTPLKFYAPDTIPRNTTAWAVPVSQLRAIVDCFIKEGRETIHFCIREAGTTTFLDSSKYELFIEGVDDQCKKMWIEDIPTRPIG